MKYASPVSRCKISSLHSRSGAALIIVLAILLLLTVLVLTFFNATRLETRGSAHSEHFAKLQQLRELPLEIVKTQIYTATTLGQIGTPDDISNTWASQPGAIRVFNRQGNMERLFKLYSSSTLEENDMNFLSTEIPSDWKDHPNAYVNLNEPFLVPASISGDPPKLHYPILNPDAQNWAEGLHISADPTSDNDATMPVEWLYVTEDGSITSYGNIGQKIPIARIAFWTDDESAKVNINTAGERTFWDRPWTGHSLAGEMRYNQPSSGEYNAYPGHPATVSLSAVLGKASGSLSSNDLVKKMLSLTPRYAWGGSENRTLPTYISSRIDLDRTHANSVTKDDRIYATETELLLNPARSMTDPQLKTAIQESGFLLTGTSRSPELNLFGMPRISLWPIDEDTTKRTVYDNLIARATQIGSQRFSFQRASQFAMDEATRIPRNFELLEYLDTLTSKTIPGFGGNFASKYAANGNRQILTEMFDFIRSGVNLTDTSRSQAEFGKQFTPALSDHRGYVLPTKINAWNTRGAGRAPVINNVGIVLYAYQQRGYDDPEQLPPDILPDDAETDVHLFLYFNFISPMVGVSPYATTYKVEVTDPSFGLRAPEVGEVRQNFAFQGSTNNRFVFTDQGKDWGGYEAAIGMQSGQAKPGDPFKDGYEFHSVAPITIKGNRMEFYGGDLEIKIYDAHTNQLLQTYTLNFPDSATTWPVPLAWQKTDRDTSAEEWQGHPGRWQSKPLYFWEREPRNVNFYDKDQSSSANYDAFLLGSRRHNTLSRSLDVIRGVELKHGDVRIIAHMDTIPKTFFQHAKDYHNPDRRIACSLLFTRNVSNINRVMGGEGDYAEFGKAVNVAYHEESQPWHYTTLLNHPPLPAHYNPPPNANGTAFTSLLDLGWSGDIDGGMNGEPDGPFMNKPDEGFISTIDPATATAGTQVPYYRSMAVKINADGTTTNLKSWDPRANGFFSPMRQIPSAIQFGSLPTGVKSNDPWRTLVFSPNSQAAIINGLHPGETAPHDHLYLDFFTMPVVEPYAISEPFSTAGKLNLNQRLIPFKHIQRETALYALLKGMMMISNVSDKNTTFPSGEATAQNQINWYKHASDTEPTSFIARRHMIHNIDIDKTIKEIAKIWDPGGHIGQGAFRSASEFTKVFLVPDNMGSDTPATYWRKYQLTADNVREAPYNYLYPLLTTQSNTYQIHYRIQTLTPARQQNSNPTFVVSGEYRGSYLIERYLDINDPRFDLNSASSEKIDATKHSLNPYYQFRLLQHRVFAPN